MAGRKSEPGQLKIDCLSEFSMRPLRLLISPLPFWRGTSCRWSSLCEQHYLGHPKASCRLAGHKAVVLWGNGRCRVRSGLSFSRTNWVEVKAA